ncbi:MAG: family 16 glycoside hydrolase, partial [Opitutae bacterium]
MNAIRISSIALFSLSMFFSAQAEKKASWISLFNGKDLSEFKGYKKDKPGNAWVAQDGAIKLLKEKGKSGGDLMT